jgi:hypothetical protein
MDSFEPVDEDEDFELELLISSREALSGYSNLAAIPQLPRWQKPPWSLVRTDVAAARR